LTAYNVVSPASMVAGLPEDISVVLANFNAIAAILNGNLDDGNVSPGAAIAIAKLAGYPADATKALLGDGSWGAAGMILATALPGVPTNGQMVAYTDSLTAPTFVWPLRYNSTALKWLPFGEGWGYGTAMPAVPAGVDRVTFVLTDNIVTGTYYWKFQYNAGSSFNEKWEFVGGAPAVREVATAENTSSTSYADLATVGPQFTIPRIGYYEITFGFNFYGNNVSSGATVKLGAAAASVTEGSSAGAGASGAGAGNNVSNGGRVGTSRTFVRGLGAGDVLKMMYRVDTVTSTFADRTLRVIPVRSQ
jgi:hypothetical protein